MQYMLDMTFIILSSLFTGRDWEEAAAVRYRVHAGSPAQSEAIDKNWNGNISLGREAQKSRSHLEVPRESLGILQILSLRCGRWQHGRGQKPGWKHQLTQGGWQDEKTPVLKKQRLEMPRDKDYQRPWSNVCQAFLFRCLQKDRIASGSW